MPNHWLQGRAKKLTLSNELVPAKFIDVIMLFMMGGWEQTEAELSIVAVIEWVELTQVTSTPSMPSIIEAVKR